MTEIENEGKQYDTATIGGGCFWCLEAVFSELEGIVEVIPGYSGGHVEHPSYEEVCGGETGHAEVVQVTFDPAKISFEEVLGVFFAIHDPTSLNRQGNDIGSQYRSVVFTRSEKQRESAGQVIGQIAKEWDFPIVTEVVPVAEFYPAEDYHRNYFHRNASQSYCRFVIDPKMREFRRKFASRIKP